MNVFNKVTLQSLKKNRTRTIVTIIGIMLSAAMICAVTTFVSSMQNYVLEYSIYNEGSWHGAVYGTNYQNYQDISKTGEIADCAYAQILGYSKVDSENEFKPYIYVMGADKYGFFQMLPVHLLSGRLPDNSTEIILPEHLASNGGVSYKIGDIITLEIGDRMLDGFFLGQSNPCYTYDEEAQEDVVTEEVIEVRETRTYTVVGIYERPNFEGRTAPGYTALTVADEEFADTAQFDVYFKMNKPAAVYDFMENMGLEGECNTDVLLYLGVSRFDTFSAMLFSLAAIVMGLIMFGSVSLIYNAFSISVSERTKQFGLLSSIGATKRQLKKMVMFEAFAVSAIGIPLGIIVGISGIGVTLLLIGEKFASITGNSNVAMTLCVSWEAVIIAIIVALITVLISAWIPSKRATRVSEVEAIRQNIDVKNTKPLKTSKLTYKLFGLPGMLASKHYKRSKKKYRTTVLSLFMSIVLFVSASAFTDYLMELVSGGFDTADYDLTFNISGQELEDTTAQDLLEKVINAKSVTGASYTQERYINVDIRSEYLTDEGLEFLNSNHVQGENASVKNMYVQISFVDDETYRGLLKEYGLNEQEYMNPEEPLAIAAIRSRSFNIHSQKYETIDFLKGNGCEIISKRVKSIDGYWLYDEIEDENGNLVVRYVKDGEKDPEYGEHLDLPADEAFLDTPLNIGKAIYERPYFVRGGDGLWLLYPISAAEGVFHDFDAKNNSYYYMITSSNHTESYASIEETLNDNGFASKTLQDMVELEESNRNIVTIIQVFSYGFIVLISLIAAANVFNTISTNISLRRREFAMLKSVGMTQKGFNKMMNFECLLYGSRALVFGLPVSCGITYLIYLAIMEGYETTFHLPWAAIGIAVLSVFLVVFVTMMYSMSKIKKDNPIDALKNENL